MKYSIIMPYYDRLAQLGRTLLSFEHFYANRNDYELVIVEDPKNKDNVRGLVGSFDKSNWPNSGVLRAQVVVSGFQGECFTPSPLYNAGVTAARGKYVILTNPECLHVKNILAGLDRAFDGGDWTYVVCACQHITKCDLPDGRFEHMTFMPGPWFQHSEHKNKMLNFCTAMSKYDYIRVGGFDERYAEGYAYADDDFRDRVLAAGMRVVLRDDLLVLHQEHKKFHSYVSRGEYKRRHTRNRLLYEANREKYETHNKVRVAT